MSQRETIFGAIRASGIDGTHLAWSVGKAPDLPWFVYETDRDPFYADDDNYSEDVRVAVHLYERAQDEATEDAFYANLRRAFGPVSPGVDTWLADENCFVTTYRFTYHPTKGE